MTRDVRHHPDPRAAATTSIQRRATPGKQTLTEQLPVQARAAAGVAGHGGPLPFGDRVAASFGPAHAPTVQAIHAHTDGAAQSAADDLGAAAYATGDSVAFGMTPDLHTAAHEAAHVVQQRQGVSLSGGVGEAGDPYEQHADAVADRVVRGESAADLLGTPGAGAASPAVQRDDRHGATVEERDAAREEAALKAAMSPDEVQLRENMLQEIQGKFHFMALTAATHLDALKADLGHEDPPSKLDALLRGLLELALGAGAAAIGKAFATRFVKARSERAFGNLDAASKKMTATPSSEAVTEFVKSFVQGGVGAGLKKGLAEASSKAEAIDRFITAHKEGVIGMYDEAAQLFSTVGRAHVSSADDAAALRDAVVAESTGAPALHYGQARDAWVTLQAQNKHGTIGDRTDMSNDADRNASAREWLADRGPMKSGEAPDALRADLDLDGGGVLYIHVSLPEVALVMDLADSKKTSYVMRGSPVVERSILNGLNEKLRAQYEHMWLPDIRIPRQIIAKVEGAPDFTLDLDEGGRVFDTGEDETWLLRRALVGHAGAPADPATRRKEGIRLLLEDLFTGKVDKGQKPF